MDKITVIKSKPTRQPADGDDLGLGDPAPWWELEEVTTTVVISSSISSSLRKPTATLDGPAAEEATKPAQSSATTEEPDMATKKNTPAAAAKAAEAAVKEKHAKDDGADLLGGDTATATKEPRKSKYEGVRYQPGALDELKEGTVDRTIAEAFGGTKRGRTLEEVQDLLIKKGYAPPRSNVWKSEPRKFLLIYMPWLVSSGKLVAAE